MSDIELKTVATSSLVVEPNQPRLDFGAESELKKNKIRLGAPRVEHRGPGHLAAHPGAPNT